MYKFIFTLLICMFGFTSQAVATVLVNPDGSVAEPYQSWVDTARVPTVGIDMPLVRSVDACGDLDVYVCTDMAAIYVKGENCGLAKSLWRTCRFFVLHENGHVYNGYMLPWKETTFARLAQWPGRPWYEEDLFGDSLSERFANSYAACATGKFPSELRVSEHVSLLPPWRPGPKRFRRICRLIRA